MKNTCRICGIDQIEEKKIGSTKIIHCKHCDINYLKDFPDQQKLDQYYSEDYDLHSGTGNNAEDEFRRLFRSTENLYLISEIKNYIEQTSSIIDVGCDKAFFLDEARRWGFNVTGIEPMKSARSYAYNIGINIYDSISKVDKRFDAVTMWHSLEHFTDPISTINNLKQLMNDNSYIFIRVPAFDSIWSKLLGKYWIWFQPENHYFHYTNKSLGYLLNSCGFKLEKITMRYANDRFTKQMNRILNSFFTYAFQRNVPIRKRMGRIYQDLTGVELFAVAKKL